MTAGDCRHFGWILRLLSPCNLNECDSIWLYLHLTQVYVVIKSLKRTWRAYLLCLEAWRISMSSCHTRYYRTMKKPHYFRFCATDIMKNGKITRKIDAKPRQVESVQLGRNDGPQSTCAFSVIESLFYTVPDKSNNRPAWKICWISPQNQHDCVHHSLCHQMSQIPPVDGYYWWN